MSTLQNYKTVVFGAGNANLTTVGYTLLDKTGRAVSARSTAGVSELPAGSGNYGALVNIPRRFHGSIQWDTGGGSPAYAVEEINLQAL